MKVRWLWLSVALLPMLIQLTWLPEWHVREERHWIRADYGALCLICATIGATAGLKTVGPSHWSKFALRCLVFVGLNSIAGYTGDLSGCGLARKIPPAISAKLPPVSPLRKVLGW